MASIVVQSLLNQKPNIIGGPRKAWATLFIALKDNMNNARFYWWEKHWSNMHMLEFHILGSNVLSNLHIYYVFTIFSFSFRLENGRVFYFTCHKFPMCMFEYYNMTIVLGGLQLIAYKLASINICTKMTQRLCLNEMREKREFIHFNILQ